MQYSVTITEISRYSPSWSSQGSISGLPSQPRRADCPSFIVCPVFRFPLILSLSGSYITPFPLHTPPCPCISSLEELNGVKLTFGSIRLLGPCALCVWWSRVGSMGWQLRQDESPPLAYNGFIWLLHFQKHWGGRALTSISRLGGTDVMYKACFSFSFLS